MIALKILALFWLSTAIVWSACIFSCLRAERAAERRWTALHPGMPLSRRPSI